jgi:hypothetical protein
MRHASVFPPTTPPSAMHQNAAPKMMEYLNFAGKEPKEELGVKLSPLT